MNPPPVPVDCLKRLPSYQFQGKKYFRMKYGFENEGSRNLIGSADGLLFPWIYVTRF